MTCAVVPPVISAGELLDPAGRARLGLAAVGTLGSGALVFADVRYSPTGGPDRTGYLLGHLPGAVFVDPDRDLAAPATRAGGRHPLPSPTTFARRIARLGIHEQDTVIGYDDAGGVAAARLVWMLRVTGHSAALLDGGLAGWTGPLSDRRAAAPTGDVPPVAFPAERLADASDLLHTQAVVLDARARARYRGVPHPLDPRPGHIPGARSLPVQDHLQPTGRLRPAEELRRLFAAAGVGDGTPVIASCGSGVTACHTWLTLELAGLGPGRLYPGSFSQWASDPTRPVVTTDAPGGCRPSEPREQESGARRRRAPRHLR